MFELEKSTNVAQLMAIVEDGLGRSSGQDGTILAVRRLGELGDARAMALLLRALDHTNVQVQTGAALSIYQLGDNYGLNQLIAWLSEERLVTWAIRALGKTKDAKAIDALQKLKASSAGRSYMFEGEMTPLSGIIENVLHKAMPEQFPTPAKATSPSDSSSNKGSCFIATAVYGSPLAEEVMSFRQFRDDVLLKSRLGRCFVRLYYFVSPPLAAQISKRKSLRTLIRRFLLEPILYHIKKGGNER